MLVFTLPKSTRGQVAAAAAHIAMLGAALAVAWQHDGPPAEKAFWAILGYFVEIAVVGVIEIVLSYFQAGKG
jgi:hypothetical protein